MLDHKCETCNSQFFLKGVSVKCLFQSTSLTCSEEKKQMKRNDKQTRSLRLLKTFCSPASGRWWRRCSGWRQDGLQFLCTANRAAQRPGGICVVSCNGCCHLGLLLRGGGRCGCALRLDDLVGDQVFWVGLQTHSSQVSLSATIRRERGKHQILTGLNSHK